jgi:hypothetical protein
MAAPSGQKHRGCVMHVKPSEVRGDDMIALGVVLILGALIFAGVVVWNETK